MSIYTIKKVPLSEVNKLIEFIDRHWKKNHILTVSNKLLYFQHFNKQEDCYNFIVAENNQTKEYDAVVGFIPTFQYDKSLKKEGDYWGAIWKIRDDVNNEEINNVAFYVWKRIFKQPYFHSYAAIGISDIAKQIYKVSRIPVDYLRQYYIANSKINKFYIGKNLIKRNPSNTTRQSDLRKIDIKTITNGSILPKYQPYKTITYFINRYMLHPIYKYFFLGIYNNESLQCIFVVRKLKIDNNQILRIIDVLGDLSAIGNIYNSIQNLLMSEQSEYVDFMNFGLSENIFTEMGFQKLNIDLENIIVPNYFEPFEQKNVKIEIAYKADFPYVAFKGDADQDRPNNIISDEQ